MLAPCGAPPLSGLGEATCFGEPKGTTEEVTLDRPPSPKSAKVEFRWLDNSIQEALRKDAKVDELVVERKKECKGAHSGDVSLKCIKADAKLSDAIVQFIRQGGDVGQPEKLP